METFVFEHVTFSYPDCEKSALTDLSFQIRESEFVLVCGKSGCGKTTLMRHLKKSLVPYGIGDGAIWYYGEDLMLLDNRRDASEIGYVGQDPESQIVTDKVWHELAFGLENLGCSVGEINRRVSEMASYFGIQTWFRKDTCELSGGQKQLLNLAAVMAMHPKAIILDEPTSQLDPVAASEFLNTLRRINQELGTTIVITEHRLEEVFPMADQVLLMEDGRLLFQGTPQETVRFVARAQKEELRELLPAPVRICMQVQPDCAAIPLTVREGRLWLTETVKEPQIRHLERPKAETPVQDTAICMEEVWFRYTRQGEDVLRGLTLNVKKGQIYALMGGNGAGKSTTLGVLSGRWKPWRGKLAIFGKRIESYGKTGLFDHCLGVLPQNPASVFTEITLEEELYEALSYEPVSREEKLAAVRDMIWEMQLDGLERMHPYDLSGGEKQRLALGKVLLRDPKLLLLDEPTKGLDPHFKRKLARILLEQKEQGRTIFMISHDIEFCGEYADQCAMLCDGEVWAADTPERFFCGNSFYTTAANRMSRHLFDNAVTCKDVVELCGRNTVKRSI